MYSLQNLGIRLSHWQDFYHIVEEFMSDLAWILVLFFLSPTQCKLYLKFLFRAFNLYYNNFIGQKGGKNHKMHHMQNHIVNLGLSLKDRWLKKSPCI